ncbi:MULTISPECIES: DUF2093 domain-containing protein [Maricaulis]|uniref:DUF2093 domain-containing protein n=1 Tax=Maricaulis maris TaxID=74318 RepID=A0A495DNZ4_9PROT|nr:MULTISPECIES: DUF2093 domain-containing protein [Maricaulis]OLF81586.1 hypothetical protein AWH62_02645 [Maricaulis sp. W15]RKR04001.1 hypothetical protein C7435_0444 [Maricaulis maris]
MSDFSFDKDFQGEAILEFGDSDFIILKAGSFVRCAVTGDPIQLDQLRYWNVDEQEAYRDVLIAKQRWIELNTEPGK